MSGLGGWPGADVLTAQTVVVEDLAAAPDGVQGMPFVVAPAARGPFADPVGRALARLVDVPVQLGPHGWALADRPGLDAARVAAFAREDDDALAVAALGYAGPLVLPVLGPVSLAAQLWLARGDRAVGDPGALRELAQSQADGLARYLTALVATVPGAVPQVLLREPLLAAARTGALPTFSGYARLRALEAEVVVAREQVVVDAVRAAGAEHVAVHVGASAAALGVARAVGADGVGLAVTGLGGSGWEQVATAVEGGLVLWAQVPPQGSSQCAGPDVRGRAATVSVPWRRVGLPADGLAGVVLLGTDEGPGATPDDARRALRGLVQAAQVLADRD